MESIQFTAYETSDPTKLGCVVHCLEQKVSKSKGLIICADKSGSMNTLMDGQDDNNGPNSSMIMTPMPSINRSMSYTPFSSSRHNPDFYSNYIINPNSRLGCVKGFLERIIDMYEFLESTQGLTQELTIILFDERCDVFSTMDSCSYKDMKRRVGESLRHNGGTNFDVALKAIDKYREMSEGEVEVIFLSDGSHCDPKVKKEQIIAEYPNSVDLAIGIGERGTEFDEETLRAISKEFVIGESAKRIRDVVSERALGIVTMLGRDLILSGTDICSNMNREKDTVNYKWPEMSMLMELYFTTQRDSSIDFSYTLKSGENIVKTIDFSKVEPKEDIEYGNKISFCLEALQKLEEAKEMTNTLGLLDKIAYLEKVKTFINDSEHLDSFKDTRLGVYLNQIREQLDKLLLTRDEQKFLDLAQNINKDAFRSTSAITSQSICTPLKSNTTSVIGNSNNNLCVVCGDENAKREVVYVPCGHFVTCAKCSVEWNNRSKCCPYCNQAITGCILVELSDKQKLPNNPMRCPSCNIRRVNLVSENCKHAFSCSGCVAKEKASVGSVCCNICNSSVDKVVKIYI